MKALVIVFLSGIILLFSAGKVSAQNYQTVNSGQIQYYKSGQLWSENIRVNKTDSVKLPLPGDSILYFHRIIRDTTQYNGSFGDCALDTMAPCWLGSHVIIKPDGENLFFNKSGDTIRFKPNAGNGDTWLLFRQQDYYFRATLDSVVYSEIEGTADSVKVVSLQAFNNSGSQVTNWFNGKSFRLSRNHGFEALYSLYDFPQDTSLYETYAYEPLSIPSIYDFEAGDVFHYENGLNQGGPPQYNIVTILSRWLSAGNDTINYLKQKKIIHNELVWDPDPHILTTTYTDTIAVSYANSDQPLTSLLPFQKKHDNPFNVSYNTLSSVDQKWNGRPTITFDESHTYDFNPDIQCFSAAFEPMYIYNSYTKGCGISYTYFEDAASSSGYYISLKYYKKGAEVWGDPYILTGTTELQETKPVLNVFPNPFSDCTEIRIETKTPGEVSLYIYSITGVILAKIEDADKQPGSYVYHQDLSNLAKGVYILMLRSGGQSSYKKIVRN